VLIENDRIHQTYVFTERGDLYEQQAFNEKQQCGFIRHLVSRSGLWIHPGEYGKAGDGQPEIQTS